MSYCSTLGVTAENNLRLTLTGPQVAMSLFTDFQDMVKFNPAPFHEDSLNKILDNVVAWSTVLKTVRKELNHV